jgi:teichuronic acid biosynthesis glycosyltransferase TuaC
MDTVIISHLFPNPSQPVNGVFVREKAKAISRYVRTTVVAPVSYFPIVRPSGTVDRLEQSHGLDIYHPQYLALPRSQFGLRWVPYYMCLRRLFEESRLRADTFFVDWVYPDAFAAVKYALKHGIKTVITVHGHRAIGYFGPPHRRKFYTYPLRMADRVIAVSEELRANLVDEYSIPSQKVAVIPNGINPAQFRLMSREAARRRLGLSDDLRIVLTVGRLSEEKAHDVLIRAFARSSATPCVLYIIGAGPLKDKLQRLILEQRLTGRVFLLGEVPHEEIHNWFCAADLFCLPSHHEGCPVVVHEALACGIPVVATRVGAVADLVCSSLYGILCEPNDTARLAQSLDQALATSWDRDTISARGSQFTWDKVAREYLIGFSPLRGGVAEGRGDGQLPAAAS